MPFWFTFWFPLANAALTLILAAATACFAWRQHNLDKNHLRAELFDRRVAVYDAMKRFVADILSSAGTVPVESLMDVIRETRHARFLFKRSDDISRFIFHFYMQGADLRFVRQEYERILENDDPKRAKLVQREHDLLDWFGKQGDVIDEKFRPYLQLA